MGEDRTVPPEDGMPVRVLPEDLSAELTETELVADIWAADARAARYVAERAVSVAALARRRRIECDRVFGARGGPGPDSRWRRHAALAAVSETFVTELALIRGCTETEAEAMAVEAVLLTTTLTGTWAELYAGRIDVAKMRALVDLLGSVEPAVVAEVEERVLPEAQRLTVTQMRSRLRRLLARLDAEALENRRADAARRADAGYRPAGDGMGQLVVDLPLARAAACADALDQYARLLRADGDERPIGVIRAAVAVDLILRPWDTGRPPVTAQLTVHAPLAALAAGQPGTAQPGTEHPARSGDPQAGNAQPAAEVDGQVVTAAQCRELLEQLDMLGVRARHRPAAACRSPSAIRLPRRSSPSPRGASCSAAQEAAGPAAGRGPRGGRTARESRSPHPGCARRRRPPPTAQPPSNAASSGSATGPAGCPAADADPAGATSTTAWPTPTAARPPAGISAACAAGTTGSRPSGAAGRSACSPMAGWSCARPAGSAASRDRPAGASTRTGPSVA